jgi:hypothetical protein
MIGGVLRGRCDAFCQMEKHFRIASPRGNVCKSLDDYLLFLLPGIGNIWVLA